MIRHVLIIALLCATSQAHPIGGGGNNPGCNCQMCNHNRAHNRGLEHDANGWYDPRTRLPVHVVESATPETAPTEQSIVDYVMDLVQPNSTDLFYDLGCGDGRFVVAAGKRGIRSIGIEIDPSQAELARRNVIDADVVHLAVIRAGDARLIGCQYATVVVMYLYPDLIRELLPLCGNCRMIVSVEHPIPGATRYEHNGTAIYVRRQ